MEGILGYINDILTNANIPYEYGLWTQTVSYPYFVGTFSTNEYQYENNHIGGTLTIDGWSRNSNLELVQIDDAIRELFADKHDINGTSVYYVRYGGSFQAPTGSPDLWKITITLFTDEWKGE